MSYRKTGDMYKQPIPPQQLRTGSDIAPSKKYTWGDAPTEKEFIIIFDLLGIFLSLMGAPSTDAKQLTAKNYSLPLVFLYGNWCYELAAGDDFQPSVVQITWGTSADEKTLYPFLGASCAGVAFTKTNSWRDKAQDKRWKYINTILRRLVVTYPLSTALDSSCHPPAVSFFSLHIFLVIPTFPDSISVRFVPTSSSPLHIVKPTFASDFELVSAATKSSCFSSFFLFICLFVVLIVKSCHLNEFVGVSRMPTSSETTAARLQRVITTRVYLLVGPFRRLGRWQHNP